MFEYSFRSSSGIAIWAEQGIFTIPSGQTMLAVDFIIGLLKEICLHYEDDLSKNQSLLDEYPSSNLNEFRSFQKREIWRIGSFIIFALNLEQILNKVFENAISFLKKIKQNDSNPFDKLIAQRQNEIQSYKYYRDKIFAHTSYGWPKKDNLSLQYTSLAYFGGLMGGAIKEDGLSFGNAYITSEGEKTPDFEELTFKEMVTNFDNHYLFWHKMFTDIGIEIEKLSYEEIKKNAGFVVKKIDRISKLVIRRP